MTSPREPSTPTTLVLVPLHALADGAPPMVRLRPGRCRRADLAPTISQVHYEAEMSAQANRMIAEDPIVTAASVDDSAAISARSLRAVAEESAAVKFERERATREGRDAARLSSRRVASLARLCEMVVAAELARRERGELTEEDAVLLVGMVRRVVEETVREVAPTAMAQQFMDLLDAQMAGVTWT